MPELERWTEKMTLLEAIAQGWGWKLGEPVAIIATNRFGNALVQNKAGQFFRITPEELQCQLLASSSSELEEKRSRGDFVRRDYPGRPLLRAGR